MPKDGQSDGEMLKGTLDMMILRTLAGGAAHGHTVAKIIEWTPEDVLEVWNRVPCIRRFIGWKIAVGYLRTGAQARTIGRRSSTG